MHLAAFRCSGADHCIVASRSQSGIHNMCSHDMTTPRFARCAYSRGARERVRFFAAGARRVSRGAAGRLDCICSIQARSST